MEPMLLKPVGKDYLWGGNRLKNEFNKNISICPLAETWECSAHPDGPSAVVNGEFAGQTLVSVLKEHSDFLGSKTDKRYGLPVLVKFIDAKRNLSIQVHPDDEFAREHENDFGKTEMWYVLDAEEGASLTYGFAHDISEELLLRAISEGDLDKHLNRVEVHKGDSFLIPAGTVHGIGAGCFLAEIQESSNVIYRLYDYDRTDKTGKKRELHIKKALQVLNRKTGQRYVQRARLVQYYPGYSREVLCRCQFFETVRICVRKKAEFFVDNTTFQIVLVTGGFGELKTGNDGYEIRFKRGDCIFLPAGIGEIILTGKCEFLKISV